MASKKYHFIYLRPEIEDEKWAHLHRFVHPGSRKQLGWAHLLCTDLELDHQPFLSCRAKNWKDGETKTILLRYDLVGSIVEVASHNDQLGFVGPDEFPVVQAEN